MTAITLILTDDAVERLERQAVRRACGIDDLLDAYVDWVLSLDEVIDDPNAGMERVQGREGP